MLQHYGWPGNVRELANLIERLAILYPGDVVEVHQLPEKYLSEGQQGMESQAPETQSQSMPGQLPADGLDMKQYIADIEVSLIEQALNESNNVVARAASLLNMRRTTLVEKMRKYGIDRHD